MQTVATEVMHVIQRDGHGGLGLMEYYNHVDFHATIHILYIVLCFCENLCLMFFG